MVFFLSRLWIHAVRPFRLVGSWTPIRFILPLQYANLGNVLLRWFPYVWVSRFWEAVFMAMTLGIAWMMSEIMKGYEMADRVRWAVLFAYILWFGAIQSETYFYYTQPLTLMLAGATYLVANDEDTLFVLTCLGVVLARSMFHALIWFYPMAMFAERKKWATLALAVALVPYFWNWHYHGVFTGAMIQGCNAYVSTTHYARTHGVPGLPTDFAWDWRNCREVMRYVWTTNLHHPFYYLEGVANSAYIFFGFTANVFVFKIKQLILAVILGAGYVLALNGYAEGPGKRSDGTIHMESFFAAYTMMYVFMVVALMGLGEGNYYRLPVEPFVFIGLGLWAQRKHG